MHSRLFAAWIALFLAPSVVSGQVSSVDEGSFAIMRAGDRVGREDFWIRSAPAPGGQALVAQANIVLGTRRIKPVLNTDTSGAILRFQSDIYIDGRLVQSYSGQTTRDHYAARTRRADGESAREFRLPNGTVVVDDDALHQLWFVARRGAGAVVPVLSPNRNVVETVRIDFVGAERLAIDTQEFETRRLRLRTDGSGFIRDVWIDAGGRVRKVSVPELKVVAVRDDAR